MYVNFNRSANFLLISISLIVVGCAETPKAPISYNDRSPISFSQTTKPEPSKLSNRLKTAQSHKNTVWERLLSLYSLPEIDNDRVERQLNWYLDHPAYIARIQQRAEPYLHLILDEIEANNIPGELALLPVVESAFIPDAYSKADASGLWQFIPDTGKLYGLEQNSWYDGRRDILDSTQAATAFLKDLGETFNGDWMLALASYNWGKGNVWKAIEKNENMSLPTDYWSLDMPKETADYVPRLIAIAKLFANADAYGIHLNHIPNKPYLEVVDIDSPLDLQKAAQLANMPLDKFMKLNPGFNRASTSPDGPNRLLVPVEKVESFKTSLAQLPFDQRVDQTQIIREQEERARREEQVLARAEQKQERAVAVAYSRQKQVQGIPAKYKVKSGETLTAIAARNNTTVQALLKANPSTGKEVRSGVVLKIPSNNKKAEPIQWTAKASKNKADNVQVAMASTKKSSLTTARNSQTLSVVSSKKPSDKTLKVALASSKKPIADKKANSSLVSRLATNKSQNYRKASMVIATKSDVTKSTRTGKKLKKV
ncbi:MAG: transglycosylase SLT domain-containing protein [Methylococcaceae bacterium]|nr:transglycosylase SLT domain-containing protein [Methylococcaceae bacterium]